MPWEDAAFVLKSKQRREIILMLESPKTPTQIAKHLGASLSNTSLKLSDLTRQGLIECLNPKDRKGRIYKLTAKGVGALKSIKEMEQGQT